MSEGKGREGKGGMEEKLLSRSRVRGERNEYNIILTYFYMCLLCKERYNTIIQVLQLDLGSLDLVT